MNLVERFWYAIDQLPWWWSADSCTRWTLTLMAKIGVSPLDAFYQVLVTGDWLGKEYQLWK